MTKQTIRQAFCGYGDTYCITTIKRGVAYLIKYYVGFNRANIHYGLLRDNIRDWEPFENTFIVSD